MGDDPSVEGTVICGATAADCVCGLPPHEEDSPHECQRSGCGGSWRGTLDAEDFRVIRFPSLVAFKSIIR